MRASVKYIVNFLAIKAVYAEDPSLLVLRAYGTAVYQLLTAGVPLTKGLDYIFVSPPGTATLQGGSPVPDAFTNAGLYDLADTMQLPNAPILTTVGNRYVNSLRSYLNNVAVPGTEPTPEQAQKYNALKDAQTSASDALWVEREAAIAAFNADPIPKPAGQTFDTWASTNYPSYLQAKTAFKTAQASVLEYNKELKNPSLDNLESRISSIEAKAVEPSASSPGYNMFVTPINPYSLTPFQRNEISDPSQIFYRPLYSISTFEEACDSWLSGKSTSQSSMSLNFRTISSADWSQLGHSTSVTRAGAGFRGMITSSNGQNFTEFTNYTATFAQDVTATLRMKGSPLVFGLRAGFWDVGSARTSYPELRANKSDTLVGQIRPEKVLIGYGLSLTISFKDAKTWNGVKTFVETAQNTTDTKVNIFGFQIGSSGAGPGSSASSNITFAQVDGRYNVDIGPTPEGVFVLLGAYGRKL